MANVLIVDNDPELIRFMLEILARKGIHGIIANDKKAAIDLLDKGNCDLQRQNKSALRPVRPVPDRLRAAPENQGKFTGAAGGYGNEPR